MPSSMLTPPDSAPSSPIASKPTFSFLSPGQNHAPSSPVAKDEAKSYTHSLLNLADSVTSTFTSSLSSFSYPPLVSASRAAILAMMNHSIAYGRLKLLMAEPNGVFVFPSYDVKPRKDREEVAEIRVIRDTFWLRLVTLGDLGFAEAYMAGLQGEYTPLRQAPDSTPVLTWLEQTFIRSRPALESSHISGVSTIPSRLFSLITSLTNSRFANTISNSISNIRAHYDLSNGMFSAFLSRDMTYSCAIFPELDADLAEGVDEGMNGAIGLTRVGGAIHKSTKALEGVGAGPTSGGEDPLEQAQLAKIRHIIRKADIRPGHRVLEIGSGWGSFAIEAVRSTSCTVDTITLSSQQKALAEERIRAAGLAGRIRVWLMDYRALPESWKGAFDRVVSIEMLEAVGKEFIGGYFSVLDQALNASGVACIQVITIPESRFEKYQREVDFIRKWIFPGGFLPTVSFVVDAIRTGSKDRLVVDSISNIGPHYARTLREWRRRFLHAFHDRVEPALRSEHPEMTDADIEVFKRKWIYYFCYCEVGFSERVLGDHIITMAREGNAEYGCTTFE
ncbi:hypothetical protein JCM24511_00907 [Saitozyma sp. JCM 24511]|nr:hypothetical protein JCM24511_00907 [Saitozyma sp. JCM 24511]